MHAAITHSHRQTHICLIYRVAQKVSHYQVIKLLNLANEIRFLCQIKVSIEHYNVIRW